MATRQVMRWREKHLMDQAERAREPLPSSLRDQIKRQSGGSEKRQRGVCVVHKDLRCG